MPRLRLVLVLIFALPAVALNMRAPGTSSAYATSAAPALQATASSQVAPTPLSPITPQTGAPVGEGTQQVLLILGIGALCLLLIAGGIYLRRWWIATRY